jgi:membrane-associated phospholipid phosphatase
MDLAFVSTLSLLTFTMLGFERMGLTNPPRLAIKGDIKREASWLAQYGQGVCTFFVAWTVWLFDPTVWRNIVIMVAVYTASALSLGIKRLVGRVRPDHPNAGSFTGITRVHDNSIESFPSGHTACAVALSATLAHYFPVTSAVVWTLAALCGILRYLVDAHWPSDILAGAFLGYSVAWAVWTVSGVA